MNGKILKTNRTLHNFKINLDDYFFKIETNKLYKSQKK